MSLTWSATRSERRTPLSCSRFRGREIRVFQSLERVDETALVQLRVQAGCGPAGQERCVSVQASCDLEVGENILRRWINDIASTLGHYRPQLRTAGRNIHYAPDYLTRARSALEFIAAEWGAVRPGQ